MLLQCNEKSKAFKEISFCLWLNESFSFQGCSVLLNHKVHAVVGVLSDDTDPMVAVMKLEKAPSETYADIGGLDQQIQV
jgi:ATP-dependent 26S proteasome regulatory subunit